MNWDSYRDRLGDRYAHSEITLGQLEQRLEDSFAAEAAGRSFPAASYTPGQTAAERAAKWAESLQQVSLEDWQHARDEGLRDG